MTTGDDTLVDLLRWFCSFESFTGEEAELCDQLQQRLHATELPAPPRRYANSLVVPVTRGTGGPHLALAGHLDVVKTVHEGPVRIEGDRFYGPGASDMKAGLAIMLDILENDRASCAGCDMSMVFYSREEGPFLDNELGIVLDADEELRGVDLAVCLEPSDNRLSLGAVGSIHATLAFDGATAHSARPWQGENAIHKAGPVLTDLGKLAPREIDLDGHVYRTVTSATLANGGRGRNVVPDRFEINLNHRFAADQTLAEAQTEIEALIGGRAAITWTDLSPAAPPHAHHPLVAALMDSGVAGVEPKQAWTDVARFAQLGIAAVNFGPGLSAQAHQRNEFTSLTKLRDGRIIFGSWLKRVAT